MKQNNKKLLINLAAGAFFAVVFTINASAITQFSKSKSLTLNGLMKNASAAPVDPPSTAYGSKCGQDDCEVVGTPWGVGVVAHGHYYHCKTVQEKSTCKDSGCTTACDAVIHV